MIDLINFKVSASDHKLIMSIVKRYEGLELDPGHDRLRLVMDISACHMNGCKLKLEELFKAKKLDFVHDVVGIQININRKTGKLDNCFLPRCAE
jgi:hypothetical protein